MKAFLLLFAALFALSAQAETLNFQNGAITAETKWEAGPNSPEESILTVQWLDAAKKEIDPGSFTVSLFMPDMGHGSAPTRMVQDRSVLGAYRITNVYFTMGGFWEVRVTLKGAGGSTETQSFGVTIPEGNVHHVMAIAKSNVSKYITPAFEQLCASSVTAHPFKKNFWHLDRPRFAKLGEFLYATMDVRPTDAGGQIIVKLDPAAPEKLTEVARFKEAIRDISAHDGKIYVLFKDRFVVVDASTGTRENEVVTTQAIGATDEEAYAFAWAGEQLVIAHGSQGMMAYDPARQAMVLAETLGMADGRHISKTTDVTDIGNGKVAFSVEGVTVSNDKPGAFNGVAIMDLASRSVEKFRYDERSSGVISQASILPSKTGLIVNNWGILQRISFADMKKRGTITTQWTPVSFEVNGKKQPGELLGEMIADGDNFVACGHVSFPDTTPGSNRILHKGVVYQGTR
jgi:hypothetical protein